MSKRKNLTFYINVCEKCKKEFLTLEENNRFCGTSCRHSFIAMHSLNKNKPRKFKTAYTWICNKCNLKFRTKIELQYHNKKIHFNHRGGWNKGLTKETDDRILKSSIIKHQHLNDGTVIPSWTGRHHTKDQRKRISKKLSTYYKNHPDKVPYVLNHSSKTSYPEQYFMDVFEKENIILEYHHQISIYELDFCSLEKKIYIEIDGEQHFQKESIECDIRRNEYLKNLGWHGYRIRWSRWQKLDEKFKKNAIKFFKSLI